MNVKATGHSVGAGGLAGALTWLLIHFGNPFLPPEVQIQGNDAVIAVTTVVNVIVNGLYRLCGAIAGRWFTSKGDEVDAP